MNKELMGCYYELDGVITAALYARFDKASLDAIVRVKNKLAAMATRTKDEHDTGVGVVCSD